jgi:3-deoxy-D-manno-octulosonate 8-phosphate phosphatase (KDO 8-P phosphatase)
MDPQNEARARNIRMIVLDVDGVMTNGQVLLMPNGEEVKQFSILDGFGIVCAMKAGIRIAIISGRVSPSLQARCQELQIEDLYMGEMEKLPILHEIAKKYSLKLNQIACVGDDVPDLPVLLQVGLSAAPSSAHPEVKSRVHLVLEKKGGEGAVREFTDLLLSAQGKSAAILQKFLP